MISQEHLWMRQYGVPSRLPRSTSKALEVLLHYRGIHT
jgi:hypothetical protein